MSVARLRAARRARSYIWTDGDSYMSGASGVVLRTLLSTATGRQVTNTAAGGATISDCLTRIQGLTHLAYQCRFVYWNGSETIGTLADYLAVVDDILDVTGLNVVFLPPVAPGPSSSSAITADVQNGIDLYDALVERGVGTFDPIDVLGPLNDASAEDLQDWAAHVVPRSLRLDSVHLNSTAMTAIANEIAATLTARGWTDA
jgi:hypothetical protein